MEYNTTSNKKRPEYLLAIMPSKYISDLLAEWKYLLLEEIDKFGSDKSLAHITVLGFDANLEQLKHSISRISKFCSNCASREISFDGFDSFGSQTFYVKPDKNSRKYLNELTRSLHLHFHIDAKNVNAHMTIARELEQIRMEKAFKFFENYETDFKFMCDSFVLRKFNTKTGQYSDIVAEFKFSEQQTKLF